MTIEQVLNNDAKTYNVTEWTKKVNRFATFEKVQFYFVAKGNGYDYDRFFVTYQIPEGIIIFSSFGYGSSLTNNGFCVVFIRDNEDGTSILETSEVTAGGKTGRVSNTPEGRRFMVHQSKNLGTIFSNDI